MGHFMVMVMTLALVQSGTCSGTESKPIGNASEVLRDLEAYLEQKIQKFKLDLHKTYESARLRHKRDTGRMTTLPNENALFEEKIKIENAEIDYSQSISQYPLTCWTSVQILKNHLAFLGTSIGELILVGFHGNRFSLLFHLRTDVAYKIKHFVYRDEVWFVVLHHNGGNHYIQLYIYDGNNLFKKQAIHLAGALDIEILHNRGTWYMGVVSKRSIPAGLAYHAEFLLYNWRHTQFDMLARSPSPGAQSVVMWDIEGTMYISVAQTLAVGSPIIAYHERDDDIMTYIQIVRANQPRKVLHFNVHANHYLLFLCPHGASIYWWAGDQFLEWLILEGTESAEDAAILQLSNGEVAIVLAFKHSVHFYMEDFSSKYVLVYVLELEEQHALAGVTFFYRSNEYYYLIALVNEDFTTMMPNMWKLNLVTRATKNEKKWDPLVTCLVALNETLISKRKDLDYIGSQIDRVWMTDKEQTVTANVVVHGSVKANRELTLQDVLVTNDNPQVPQATNGQVKKAALDVLSEVKGLKADMNDVVFKSHDQTIHGPLRFTKPVAVRDGIMGNVGRDLLLNEMPMSSLRDLALKVDGDQIVDGSIVVPDVLVHNLEIEGHVNNLAPRDMLLLHGNQIVTGNLHFPGAVLLDLIIKRGGTINDLSAMAKKAVLTTGNRVISDNVEFIGPVVIRGNLVIGGRINDHINLTALTKFAVDLDSQQFIGGQKVFKFPVYVRGDTTVDGKTNGLNIREDVFTLDTEQKVPGNLTFLDSIHFVNDLATSLVNGLPLHQEAVLKHMLNQVVPARKNFRGSVKVLNDVSTSPHGTLGGVDLSDLAASASRPENLTLYGQTIFQDLTIGGMMHARGTFNGISLSDFNTLLWRKSLNQVIRGPVGFLGKVVFENDLEIKLVNGMNLDDDFMHTFQDEEIGGVKSFADNLNVEMPLRMAPGVRINNFDLTEMSRTVVYADGQPQVVYGHKMFPRLDVLGDVHVRGLFNGLKLSEELMLSDREQLVNGHVIMNSPVTVAKGLLQAEKVQVDHNVNGVELSEFASRAVMADHLGQFPIRNKNFLAGLKASNMWSEHINRVDINHLLHKAIRIDTPQVLETAKNFTDMEFVGFQVGSLNGLDLHQHVDRVVLLGDSIIFGPKTVAGSLKMNGDLKTFGPINGVDIRDLSEMAILKDKDNIITAPLSFAQGLDIDKLHVGEFLTIDGIGWNDLVFLNEEEFLQGNNHFQDNLVVVGNVIVAGLVDGCNVNDLTQSALFRDREHQVVEGLTTIENLVVHGNSVVDGPVNGLNLNRLASDILRKSSDQSVTSSVGFYSQVNVKNLELTNHLNGNIMAHLFSDAVLKSVTQEIRGIKTLKHPEGVLFGSDLTVDGNLDVRGEVNGIDLSNLGDMTVKKHGSQVIFGHKIFQDIETLQDISISGLLNGVKIPEDLVLRYGADTIEDDTTFSAPITIERNILITGAVNGILLDELFGKRVTLHGDDVVFSNLTFPAPIEIGSLELPLNINGLPVGSLITRSGSQTIMGNKNFRGDVTIDGDLTTLLLNNQDIRELDSNVVRHNRDEIVRGLTVFKDYVEIDSNVAVLGMVNGLNVGGIPESLQKFRDDTDRFVDDLRTRAEVQNLLLKKQFNSHTYQFSEFAYFELVQTLPIKMTNLFSSVTYGFSRPAFVAKPASHLFGWSADGCSRLDCCSQSTFIFQVENDGQLSFESGPHQKRLFAFVFSNRTLFTPGYLNGFLLWTNTSSRSISCGIGSPEETVIVSLHGTGLSPLESKQAMTNFQAEYSPYVEDAKIVEIDSNIYMIVAYSYSKKDALSGPTTLYLYNKDTNLWSHYQTLKTHGAMRLDVTQIMLEPMQTLLVISSRPISSNSTVNSYSSIYRWDTNSKMFSLVREIPSHWPSSVLWVDNDHDLYLFIANEKSPVHQYYHEHKLHLQLDSFADPVTIYRYNSVLQDVILLQNIGIKGVISMAAYKLAGEIFVAAASQVENSVFILQLQGFGGFSVIQQVPAYGVNDVHVYWSKSYRLHLAIASDLQTQVLRSIIRGHSLLPVEGRPLFVDYEALVSPGDFLPPPP